mmetsp:Transcript_38447/g.121552  ORF Transcript_38447/g.121552 Transcript_38447/m.121552 type:complete len:331 (+) Transcript_38447:5315-6307(+)
MGARDRGRRAGQGAPQAGHAPLQDLAHCGVSGRHQDVPRQLPLVPRLLSDSHRLEDALQGWAQRDERDSKRRDARQERAAHPHRGVLFGDGPLGPQYAHGADASDAQGADPALLRHRPQRQRPQAGGGAATGRRAAQVAAQRCVLEQEPRHAQGQEGAVRGGLAHLQADREEDSGEGGADLQHGGERQGGGGHGAAGALRLHPHGLRYAHHGRVAGHQGDPEVPRSPHPHHRGDGQLHEGRPAEVPQLGNGRLHVKARVTTITYRDHREVGCTPCRGRRHHGGHHDVGEAGARRQCQVLAVSQQYKHGGGAKQQRQACAAGPRGQRQRGR